MSDQSAFGIATWRAPDPRTHGSVQESETEICATRPGWSHIIQRHLANQSEPWREWFPAPLLRRLLAQQFNRKLSPQYKDALTEASQLMGKAISSCLQAPRALLYERRRHVKDKVQRQGVWELLLDVGVVVIIHEKAGRNVMWTAYFPLKGLPNMGAQKRFKEAIAYQIRKFTNHRRLQHGEKNYLATRGPVKKKRTTHPEWCHHLNWVTLTSWGFKRTLGGSVWQMPTITLQKPLSVDDVAQTAKVKLRKPSPPQRQRKEHQR